MAIFLKSQIVKPTLKKLLTVGFKASLDFNCRHYFIKAEVLGVLALKFLLCLHKGN
jgi:hypothetical protein